MGAMTQWAHSMGWFLLALLHSPTFWTGAGSIGTIATLFLIYKQIAGARNVTAYEFLRKEDDRFNSPQMKKHRANLARLLISSPNFKLLDEESACGVCGYFEDLGLLLRRGITPKYLTWTMFDYRVLRYWKLLEPYIETCRKETGDDTYYREFEYLYNQMLRFETKMTRRGSVAVGDADLKKYVHQEIRAELRFFRLSDLGRVMEIERSSFDIDAYTEDRFRDIYKNHPEGFRVAEVLGTVVGYIAATISDEAGEIDSMAVDRDYRHLGIGHQFLERTLRYFESAHPELKVYSLEVRTTNETAIRLYEKMGFKTTAILKGYYKDHADAFVMQKPIKLAAGKAADDPRIS